jgi:hypothetical protein
MIIDYLIIVNSVYVLIQALLAQFLDLSKINEKILIYKYKLRQSITKINTVINGL